MPNSCPASRRRAAAARPSPIDGTNAHEGHALPQNQTDDGAAIGAEGEPNTQSHRVRRDTA